MSDISRIGSPFRAAPAGITPHNGHRQPVIDPPPSRGDDRVELSDRALWLSKLRETPSVRQDVVDRVRGPIARGTYETNDRIEGAIDKLLEDLA
jgi:negative regulator of flagellin synthesis FlgM